MQLPVRNAALVLTAGGAGGLSDGWTALRLPFAVVAAEPGGRLPSRLAAAGAGCVLVRIGTALAGQGLTA